MRAIMAFRRRFLAARHSRGTAVLEFAIVAPTVALFLAGAADYGLAEWSRSCLSNAVSQAGYYAFRQGTSVTTANITSVIQNAFPLTGAPPDPLSAAVSAVSVTFPPGGTTGVACYCPSGTPASLGSAVSCASTCPDTTKPGYYIQIKATYTLRGTFRVASSLSLQGDQISDTITVRLQ
jgi:Flp pilus assembly protein TadG